MSMSGKQIIFCVIVVVSGATLYFGNEPGEGEHKASSTSETRSGSSDTIPREFAGYECTQDCSGHEAGYSWAQEHDISDGDDCDIAGEHSNSPSFAEGCHAYVDGDGDSEESEDHDQN